MSNLSQTLKEACLWLRNRNGDGGFDRNQVLLAGGDHAPFNRSTWNKLEAAGLAEFYQSRRRIRLTEKGRRFDIGTASDRGAVEDRGSYGKVGVS